MDFEELKNPWSEYRLPDGRLMRCRHILTDVVQTGVDSDGVAQYHLNFGVMIHIEPTEKQKAEIVEQANQAQVLVPPPKGTMVQ
jgi:hypothetical protein